VSESSFSQDGRCAVVAHRGASAREAENTLEAFELAVAACAEVVEFDVRMSADGVAVVMHDADVARTTDGSGLVKDLRLAEIKDLRIALRDGGVTEVPTLEEALRCCSGRIAVDVEIKNIPGEPDFDAEHELAVEATLRALEDIAFSGATLISSFNPFSIGHVMRVAPDVPTGLLTPYEVDADVAFAFAREQGHTWVLPFVDRVREADTALIGRVHASGMRIGTWITDDPAVALELMGAGLDAVATNDPAPVVAARAQASPA
jgi:glycerophosphoryl diester phosphodiesterase